MQAALSPSYCLKEIAWRPRRAKAKQTQRHPVAGRDLNPCPAKGSTSKAAAAKSRPAAMVASSQIGSDRARSRLSLAASVRNRPRVNRRTRQSVAPRVRARRRRLPRKRQPGKKLPPRKMLRKSQEQPGPRRRKLPPRKALLRVRTMGASPSLLRSEIDALQSRSVGLRHEGAHSTSFASIRLTFYSCVVPRRKTMCRMLTQADDDNAGMS